MDLAFVIIMGGLWGSFANVCIYRLPEQKSVVSGRSFCPNCKKKIVWYDNIPIISYFLLGAKCRNCKKHISIKYLIVELINTISFITIYYIFGISLTTIFLMSLSLSFLIILFGIFPNMILNFFINSHSFIINSIN